MPSLSTWSTFETTLSSTDKRLVIACIVQDWNRLSIFLMKCLQEIVEDGDIRFAEVVYINADEEREKCFEIGLSSPPALMFYWEGTPIMIRRPEWPDDKKYVGVPKKETLLELIRFAKEAGERKLKHMNCD